MPVLIHFDLNYFSNFLLHSALFHWRGKELKRNSSQVNMSNTWYHWPRSRGDGIAWATVRIFQKNRTPGMGWILCSLAGFVSEKMPHVWRVLLLPHLKLCQVFSKLSFLLPFLTIHKQLEKLNFCHQVKFSLTCQFFKNKPQMNSFYKQCADRNALFLSVQCSTWV